MKKYCAAFGAELSLEDYVQKRVYQVVHTQSWDNGRCLLSVASCCTRTDAERIADCLNACEGTQPQNIPGGVNQLLVDHARLKIVYNNLRHGE